ncbi:sodium- and chloride-dependent GABA transporter 2-like [Uloborus diversus]|uniref:sodium- and chloride-dependent GABA transporter 2-like n=1 Tax=Uloborus diversus TaxID=327109 RepID=UPI0024092AFB|nr:sodium- and chloride-dependent GABA transporter 2-like [Uloborus diversus]
METAPVDRGGGKRWKFKSDERIGPPRVSEKLLSNLKENHPRPVRCLTPDGGKSPKVYLPPGSPVLEVKSRFTFGTSTECLPNGDQQITAKEGLVRTSSFLSQRGAFHLNLNESANLPKSVPFGRSRRMSRSLPELRDIQFVSVLPDLEEEESESSEFQEEIVYEKPTRVPWHRKLDFLWCSVCQALGLSNIWRFPYYCYSNGGGSFVFPYIVFMVVCSVPLLCMELAVGQVTQSGPISAFGQLCPLMKGIGVASMMLSFWLTAYYSVLTSWTMFYTFNSFYSPPRWTRCTNTWNSEICHESTESVLQSTDSSKSTLPQLTSELPNLTDATLTLVTSTLEPILNTEAKSTLQNSKELDPDKFMSLNISHPAMEFLDVKMLDKSNSIEESGELRFELLASVLFVWILTYFALRKTDFFRGTTIYVLTVTSHLLLFSVFLRTVALDGAKNGLKHLFVIDWDTMLDPRVLLYSLAQAFHSLGVILGPSILMGSCHKQHNNLLRDTIILTLVTLLTVLLIGCVTFATIGHLAEKLRKPFWKVLNDDPGNVFVIYSVAIGTMPFPSCWGALFFLTLLCLGLDSEIKLVATLISALKEAYTYYIKQRFQGHSMFLAVICGFCFVASIPYLTQAGIFFFQLIDHYIAVIATCVVALLEVSTLSWLYGASNLSSCIRQMTGKSPSYFYQFSWMILSPLTILATLIYSLIKMSGTVVRKGYRYPPWAHVMGWILVGLTLCWIPFLAIAAYRKTPKSHLVSRLTAAIQPRIRSQSESMWEPKPVIILNGSTVTASEFPDYKLPELPTVLNSVQTYVEKHSALRQNAESAF